MKEVFLDSDTDIAVVSALWGARGSNPTPIEYAATVGFIQQAYREDPNPSFQTFGPKTRREFLQLLAKRNGRPG